MQNDPLKNPVQYLKFVGPKRAEAFAKAGINTVRDLLYYFPSRYLDRSTIISINRALKLTRDGYEGELTIIAKVTQTNHFGYGKKRIFKVTFEDDSGSIECIWFQGIKYVKDIFKEDKYFAISGKPVISKYGHLQIAHPDFDRIEDSESKEFINTGKIIPFYKKTKELREGKIGDLSLRKIINMAVEKYCNHVDETLPEYILKKEGLLNINDTIKNIHFPADQTKLDSAKQRMKFEESLFFQLLLELKRKSLKDKHTAQKFIIAKQTIKKLLNNLQFDLTDAQLRVLTDIRNDFESGKPMNRLLQGDVGSGKTIVALIAMLITSDNNYQSALMAPTEILAMQHYQNITNLLSEFDIQVVLITGSQPAKQRTLVQKIIKDNKNCIIIGTHALFEEKVTIPNLGLIVIDEQHRFGVVQRSRLIEKSVSPHILAMTATPIPRTLTMTLYGDLDVSIIDELPKYRQPVKTVVRFEKKLPAVFDFVKSKIADGYQSFLVYPLVEESDKINLGAAEVEFKKLSETYFQEVRIGLIHGKMKWKEKERIMHEFAQKKYDVLVSTTVIEVGIDIPEANIIIINNADRFGLSQLHQLRGRVGRGSKKAYCILITGKEYKQDQIEFDFNFEYMPPTQIERNKAIIKLNALVKYSSGFKLSEIDLKLRGPGEIFGIKQSGLPSFQFIDVVEDEKLIYKTKAVAHSIILDDPGMKNKKNFLLRSTLRKNYAQLIVLSNIA